MQYGGICSERGDSIDSLAGYLENLRDASSSNIHMHDFPHDFSSFE